MRILFAASEVYPVAKTGGLADVAGSLPKALVAGGHDVTIIMPRYGSVRRGAEPLASFQVPMGEGKLENAVIQRTYLDDARRIPVLLVHHEHFFGSRKDLYAFPDDGWRFAFFSRAVVEVMRRLDLQPDVVHCHDWHTGLVPAYLNALGNGNGAFSRARVVFTIHNLQYQGIFGREVFTYSGLPESMFTLDGLEYYGNINCLKSGIVYSKLVTTVSPTYAREIQSREFGNGLHGLLQSCAGKLSGIVNGIDYEVWNPSTDPNLSRRFGPHDLAGKRDMKRALQEEARITVSGEIPTFSFIGRLVGQKGMDVLMPILPEILRKAQVVVLGTGDPVYHEQLSTMSGKAPNLAVYLKFDEELAHRIYAGSDALLMPSWFEPCGLGQLIALRYGTLPIVRRTGGLADTVRDADADPDNGTGFSFADYSPEPLLDAIRRAVRAYSDKAQWSRLVVQAMAQDFSWSASKKKYEDLYQAALQ